MNFSEISKTLRKERNLSQVELAKALNVSKACISMIEIGRNEPTANTLIRYADFFECSVDYLLGREDDFGNITVTANGSLPKDEETILRCFRVLPADLQQRALAYMQKLENIIQDEKI
ncbi:MAG: helix-turn-helix domain-containing protein [Clostridia bacterium]|nr:helix-turn-helix domain-containing protein [Clostridia bacterium]MBQ3505785.1 helix-turn-helix domain-containing protein [Clostridia bacterium]